MTNRVLPLQHDDLSEYSRDLTSLAQNHLPPEIKSNYDLDKLLLQEREGLDIVNESKQQFFEYSQKILYTIMIGHCDAYLKDILNGRQKSSRMEFFLKTERNDDERTDWHVANTLPYFLHKCYRELLVRKLMCCIEQHLLETGLKRSFQYITNTAVYGLFAESIIQAIALKERVKYAAAERLYVLPESLEYEYVQPMDTTPTALEISSDDETISIVRVWSEAPPAPISYYTPSIVKLWTKEALSTTRVSPMGHTKKISEKPTVFVQAIKNLEMDLFRKRYSSPLSARLEIRRWENVLSQIRNYGPTLPTYQVKRLAEHIHKSIDQAIKKHDVTRKVLRNKVNWNYKCSGEASSKAQIYTPTGEILKYRIRRTNSPMQLQLQPKRCFRKQIRGVLQLRPLKDVSKKETRSWFQEQVRHKIHRIRTLRHAGWQVPIQFSLKMHLVLQDFDFDKTKTVKRSRKTVS